MADTTGTAISCDDLNRVYAGFSDSDGNYRFVDQEKTTTDWYIATYDGVNGPDGETHVELITFTEPTNWNAQEQIYFFSGGIELLIDKDYIRYRISGTAWNETPASNPPSDITIIYTKDQLGIAAIIFDGYIWQIINGGIGKLQKYTGNHTTGHIDWFTNGTDTIKQYIPSTDKNGITLFLSNLKYSMLAGSFQELNAADVWNTDEIVSIYDDDDVLLAKMLVVKSNKITRTVSLRSPATIDLSTPITLTSATNLDTVLEDNLIYCTSDVTPTISVPACTEKLLSAILQESVIKGGYVWYITPDLVMTVNDGTSLSPIDYKTGVNGVVQWGTAANPDLGDWTNTEGDSSNTIVANLDGHRNVQYIQQVTAGYTSHNFSESRDSGTVEFWFYAESNAKQHQIQINDADNHHICYCGFWADGKIDFNSAVDLDSDIITYNADEWIHGKIEIAP